MSKQGPLKELYAKCEKCSSTYHPSCAKRAEIRDNGSSRRCCQEVDDSTCNESITSRNDQYNSSIEDESKNEDLSEPESIESTNIKKSKEVNGASDELLGQIQKLIKNELKECTRNINDNIDTKTEAISSKMDCLNIEVDGDRQEKISHSMGNNGRVNVASQPSLSNIGYNTPPSTSQQSVSRLNSSSGIPYPNQLAHNEGILGSQQRRSHSKRPKIFANKMNQQARNHQQNAVFTFKTWEK
ncbi:hypothetical protein QAD02_002259 [Eretmocerus hayati]|uniref:Uncharacterized protein n=1 Tax=Eretmocerus hayati TaxID=131215 RepID=A0ACC2NIL5_9HYME|nr:hypothetical protein QAD02_002259 [Eretmocerus hayati]